MDIISIIATSIGGGGIVGTLLTIVYNRRKAIAEAEKINSETSSQEIDNYKKMREIIKSELEPYIERIKSLENEITLMKNDVCFKKNCLNREK